MKSVFEFLKSFINKSIEDDSFSDSLKSNLTPIFKKKKKKKKKNPNLKKKKKKKKKKDSLDKSNYRSVIILTLFLKVCESLIYNQPSDYTKRFLNVLLSMPYLT